MPITEKINDIIDHRKGRGVYMGKGHLEVVTKKLTFLQAVKKVLDEYTSFRNTALAQIANKKGDYYNMSLEDPAFEQKINNAAPDDTIAAVDEAIGKLEELKARFDRDTINISVIGRKRQGKSRLIQSITGLDNDIIPADNGGDCTGAKSEICNAEGPLHAIIYCYNEQELVEQVQVYLNKLGSKTVLGSMSQIKTLDVDSIAKQKLSNKQESWLERLYAYVEHYDEYAPLVGQQFNVNSKEDIRQYVAQYLVDMTPVYKYLAVKEVQIFTPFNYSDAGQIQLVDTIGLGDAKSLGLQDKMVDTLVNDSDAAVMVRMPSEKGDSISDEDNELYDFVNEQMKGRDIEKWLFFVLNVYPGNKKVSESFFQQLEKKVKGKTLRAAFVKKVNCSEKEDVEANLLVPMLDFLSTNLSEVDNSLMAVANELLTSAHSLFFELSGKVEALADSSFRKDLSTGATFDVLFEDELNLARRLSELNAIYKDHTQKCKEIDDEVRKSIKQVVAVCPDHEEILKALKGGGLSARPQVVHSNMSDYYRASISDKFDEINTVTIVQLQENLQHAIIQILRSEDGGRLDAIPLNTEADNPDDFEWLQAFINQRLGDFPIVKAAFEDILNYRLNIEGLLEYYVNISLVYLDPNEKEFYFPNFKTDTTTEDEADTIEQTLLSGANAFASRLIKLVEGRTGEGDGDGLQGLLQIPYNSYYARIKRFRERIIFSKEGERDLKNMYREYATYVWRERFSAIITKQAALKGLKEIIDKFSENRTKSLFTIKF